MNISQGLSEVVTHSFSGIQKSYAGISICTFRSICTIVNIPIVAYTDIEPFCKKSPPNLRQIDSGILQGGLQGHLHSQTFADRAIGVATWTVAFGRFCDGWSCLQSHSS